MAKKTISAIENFIIFVIFLVLIQTFLSDLASYLSWPWAVRKTLMVAGFGFDIFFSIEFLIRFIIALSGGTLGKYFIKERGWVDFIASIPLLVFSSGPQVLSLMSGVAVAGGLLGFINVIKVIKAIRIARILRLLRLLKIFKKIKYADSVMAQRHMAKLATLTITSLITGALLFSIVVMAFGGYNRSDDAALGFQNLAETYNEKVGNGADPIAQAEFFFELDKALMIIKDSEERTVKTRYTNEYYTIQFGPFDYLEFGGEDKDYTLYFDKRELDKNDAKESLTYFILVICILVTLLILYSPHFAITVTDPILIMQKGMNQASYNLQIEIPDNFEDDDVFRLAKIYNDKFLPLKARTAMSSKDEISEKDLQLHVDDFSALFNLNGTKAPEDEEGDF